MTNPTMWRRAGAAVALAAVALAPMALAPTAALAQGEVNIYSHREPKLLDPLLAAFTAKTGIKTNVVFARDGLVERIVAEGQNSPADLFFTVDAGLLSQAKTAGITQPAKSAMLDAVPAAFRDSEGHWYGLSMRSRVIYASKDRVKQDAITYEELADPKWKGKLCTRSGQHVYNTALVATMIAEKGAEATEAWLKGVKANLARKPAGGDREQVRDVQAGLCDIALANTYYMAAMQKNPEQKAWADAVRIIFPNAANRGSHVNIAGVALVKSAKNKDAALKLMDFLTSEEGQKIYAEVNNEYPVSAKVEPSALVKSWGTLKPDTLPLENIAKNRKQASELIDKVGFDNGPGT